MTFSLRSEGSVFWKLSKNTDLSKEKLYKCKRKYSAVSIQAPHEHIGVAVSLKLFQFMLNYVTELLSETLEKL